MLELIAPSPAARLGQSALQNTFILMAHVLQMKYAKKEENSPEDSAPTGLWDDNLALSLVCPEPELELPGLGREREVREVGVGEAGVRVERQTFLPIVYLQTGMIYIHFISFS